MSDPYWHQKHTKKRNRDHVLHALAGGPRSFTQLRNEVGLSKPVLSSHLKDLGNRGDVVKAKEDDRMVYKLAEQAFEIPSLRSLHFEGSVYRGILVELINENEVLVHSTMKETLTQQDVRRKEKTLYWDLKEEYLAEKSELSIVQAIDKWLTPFILFCLVKERQTEVEWTQAVCGLTRKLLNLFGQKNIDKLEEALKNLYSDRVYTYNKLSIFENLNRMFESSEGQKQVYDHFSKVLEEVKRERERIRW